MRVIMKFDTVTISNYIRTECCDVPIGRIEDLEKLGHWVLCMRCLDFKAFIPQEDKNCMRMPSIFNNAKVWEDFQMAVRETGKGMQKLLDAAWEVDPIIGQGTEMVDGEWKPTGFLAAIQDENYYNQTVQPVNLSSRDMIDQLPSIPSWQTQEDPQSDD